MRALNVPAVIALALMAQAACSSASIGPSATVTTLQPVWPQFLTLEWSERTTGSGRIEGYIYNSHGLPAIDVQILAQALDASGAVVGQQIVWVTDWVPPHNRSFFSIGGLPKASAYRVSVWNFRFRDAQAG